MDLLNIFLVIASLIGGFILIVLVLGLVLFAFVSFNVIKAFKDAGKDKGLK